MKKMAESETAIFFVVVFVIVVAVCPIPSCDLFFPPHTYASDKQVSKLRLSCIF